MRFRTPKPAAAAAPVSLHIGHLNHVSRADALARVQGLIRRQAAVPEMADYRLAKTGGGFAYEIQEGGAHKAYLPALLKRLRDAPDAPIYLRAGNRVVRVQGGTEGIVSVVLPEDEQPDTDDIQPSGRMRPFEATGTTALFTAATVFAVGAVALVGAVLVSSMAAEHWDKNARAAVSRRVERLPIQHWPPPQPLGTYVSRVQYVGGHWSIQTKHWKGAAHAEPPALPSVELRPGSDSIKGD